MEKEKSAEMTRRELLGGMAAWAGIYAVSPVSTLGAVGYRSAAALPDSNFHGVQIGAITYSFRSMPSSAEDLLKYATQAGLSSIELMGGPAEAFAGAPVLERGPRMGQLTDEERARLRAERESYARRLREWRLQTSMDRFRQTATKEPRLTPRERR